MSRLELRKGGKEMKRRLGIIGVLIISISLFYGCAGVEVAKAPEPPTEAQETGELRNIAEEVSEKLERVIGRLGRDVKAS